MALHISIIAPDRTVWDSDAEEVILPSSTGQLGILRDHAPLLTALDIGIGLLAYLLFPYLWQD